MKALNRNHGWGLLVQRVRCQMFFPDTTFHQDLKIIIKLKIIKLNTILDSEFRCYKYTKEDYASLLGNHDYQTNRVKVKLPG